MRESHRRQRPWATRCCARWSGGGGILRCRTGATWAGEFTEYKDPGHFVGKGWMELNFDRIYVRNTVLPVDARVVGVPEYKIDEQGRIRGKGHAVRDTVLWMIPVLWPIDLIELPRRGPRPTLKEETILTLRLMQDVTVPDVAEPQRAHPNGLIQRGENEYPQAPQQEAPPEQGYAQPAPDMGYAPQPEMAYAPPPPPVVVPYAYAPMAYPVFPPLVVGIGGYGGYGAYRGYGGYGVRPGVPYGRGVYGGQAGNGVCAAGRVLRRWVRWTRVCRRDGCARGDGECGRDGHGCAGEGLADGGRAAGSESGFWFRFRAAEIILPTLCRSLPAFVAVLNQAIRKRDV